MHPRVDCMYSKDRERRIFHHISIRAATGMSTVANQRRMKKLQRQQRLKDDEELC